MAPITPVSDRIPVRMARKPDSYVQTYVGPPGEPLWNTDTKRVHYQDGETPGGWPVRLLTDGLAGEVLFDTAQALTDPQKLQAWQNLGLDGTVQQMNCRLAAASASSLILQPSNGSSFVCNGQTYKLTPQAQSIASWNLTPFGCYDIYVDKAGALTPSASGPTTGGGLAASDVDAYGFICKKGDPTKTLVGRIAVDGSGNLRDDLNFRGVWSAFNRRLKKFANQGSGSTSSTSFIQLNTPCYVITSQDDVVDLIAIIAATDTFSSDLISCQPFYNGSQQGFEAWFQSFANNSLGNAISTNIVSTSGLVCFQPSTKTAGGHSYNFFAYLGGAVRG